MKKKKGRKCRQRERDSIISLRSMELGHQFSSDREVKSVHATRANLGVLSNSVM